MTLYKYLRTERSDILETGHIRYTQPVYLNDPFEMRPDLSGIMTGKSLLRLSSLQTLTKGVKDISNKVPPGRRWLVWIFALVFTLVRFRNIRTFVDSLMAKMRNEFPSIIEEKFRKALGVLSLTSNPHNLLMWSHYAQDHTGLVIAVNEKHAVFNERRGDEDELRHLRKVVYSKRKPRPNLKSISGVDLLLRKSKAWAHEDEWRIVKAVADATATGMKEAVEIFLFPLPPDAIEGVIFGAHISEQERDRIIRTIYSRPELDHIWLKQAEISDTSFELKFVRLPGYVGQYPEPKGEFRFHNIPEDRQKDIVSTLNLVLGMCFRQPLDLSRMKWVHITDDVSKTVSEMTKQPYPGTKDGYVLGLSQVDDIDAVLFLSMTLFPVESASTEDEARLCVHKIHRELVHVHNVTVRFHALGEKALTAPKPGTAWLMEPVAFSIWNDYIVARLSASSYPIAELTKIVPALVALRDSCSFEVAKAIVAYKKDGNLHRLMVLSAIQLQNLLCEIATVEGYADGIADKAISDVLTHAVNTVLGRDYGATIRDMRKSLRRMHLYYPTWEDGSIYGDLMMVARMLAFQWGLPMRDMGKKMHVAIN